MPYNQTKLDEVIKQTTENVAVGDEVRGEHDLEIMKTYFGAFKKKRVSILDIFYYHPARRLNILSRARVPTSMGGVYAYCWDVDNIGPVLPFTKDSISDLWVGRAMLKYFTMKGDAYWKGRKVHDVNSGLNCIGIWLATKGAEVISRSATSETLVVGACNLALTGTDIDYGWGFDSDASCETLSDTYVFDTVLVRYGYAQSNVDLMRWLSKLGKEVLFTLPNIRLDVAQFDGGTYKDIMDLKESEFEEVFSAKFAGDPPKWGERKVYRMINA
jgi:hypothetical protein